MCTATGRTTRICGRTSKSLRCSCPTARSPGTPSASWATGPPPRRRPPQTWGPPPTAAASRPCWGPRPESRAGRWPGLRARRAEAAGERQGSPPLHGARAQGRTQGRAHTRACAPLCVCACVCVPVHACLHLRVDGSSPVSGFPAPYLCHAQGMDHVCNVVPPRQRAPVGKVFRIPEAFHGAWPQSSVFLPLPALITRRAVAIPTYVVRRFGNASGNWRLCHSMPT
mmetsp:Transcript_64072/g.198415  ORF Transcript_64072/g.198415 Transcript_64072/m.198415 type:complete len:226 (+) Transcript_64072:527-1204(+)